MAEWERRPALGYPWWTMSVRELWREKADDEVAAAGQQLSDYGEDARQVIRAEMRRRGIVETPVAEKDDSSLPMPVPLTTDEILFSFGGRIGRGTFLKWSLVLTVLVYVGYLLDFAIWGKPDGFLTTFALLQLWPYLAITVKRVHDRNRSLWILLLYLVPLVGGVWWMIELFGLKGTEGDNRFGADPLKNQTT